MTADTAEPEYTTETWRWMGERTGTKGDRHNTWQDPAGQPLYFAAKPSTAGGAVGGYYTATVLRHDDGEGLSLRAVQFERQAGRGDALADQWRAEDRAARTRASARRRERDAAKANELDEALAPLLAIAGKLRTHADQEALMMLVLRRMNGAWYTR
jgi:hypothetical protein